MLESAPHSPAKSAVEEWEEAASDDASDAYSSIEDEDEPLADLFDELECAAQLQLDDGHIAQAEDPAQDDATSPTGPPVLTVCGQCWR